MSSSNVHSIDLHGLHGLTVLDDETIDWLLNTCPEGSAAKEWIVTTRSHDDEDEV